MLLKCMYGSWIDITLKQKSEKEKYFLTIDLWLNFQFFTQKHMFYTTIHVQKL